MSLMGRSALLNARLLGGGAPKVRAWSWELSSSQWVSGQGWKWGSAWGQPHQIHLREAGRASPWRRRPSTLSPECGQDSERQARGGRFIQEKDELVSRSALEELGSTPPAHCRGSQT